MTFLNRVKDRKLVQWGLAYLASAWLLLQVVAVLGGTYAWPSTFMRAVPVVLAAGFFATLVVAWYHAERGAQRVSGAEVAILTVLLAVAGLGVALVRESSAEVGAAAPAATAGALPGAPAPLERASIAVLPFENMSADPEQEYFSDGLTEELLNALAQVPGLRVAARTSSFAFKGRGVPVDSIGRALRVAHLVEGSVRKAGGRVRITAQLVDAGTGYRRWSQSYDRELTDVFAMQDEIGRAVAAELRVTLAGEAPLIRQETGDPEAHALVLRGMSKGREGTREARLESERLYREAIRRDPGYARAHQLLGASLMWQAFYRYIPPQPGYTQARVAAERALALDPALAEAHTVLGYVAERLDWDFVAADEHYRRALALRPDSPVALYLHALLLGRMGHHREAVAAARRAVDVDPLGWLVHNVLGIVYVGAGQIEQAVEQYEAAIALAPRASTPVMNLAHAYVRLGRYAEAIEAAERGWALEPEDHIALTGRASVYARAGRRAEAERALAEAQALPHVSPYRLAIVHVALGDRERALSLLERAVEERDDNVTYIGTSHAFVALRGDPRFERLLRRVGLR